MAWFDLVLKLSAIIGGALAILTFWRTANVRRAEWLSSLHTKFFETSTYKEIRRVLDSSEADPGLSSLRAAIVADETSGLVESFVDYLNFFEFVATLRRLGQLKPKEIQMLFHYYLRLLCRHDFARNYIRTQDFEGLESLLNECFGGTS